MRAYAKYFAIFTMIFLITGSNAFPQVEDIFHPLLKKIQDFFTQNESEELF